MGPAVSWFNLRTTDYTWTSNLNKYNSSEFPWYIVHLQILLCKAFYIVHRRVLLLRSACGLYLPLLCCRISCTLCFCHYDEFKYCFANLCVMVIKINYHYQYKVLLYLSQISPSYMLANVSYVFSCV